MFFRRAPTCLCEQNTDSRWLAALEWSLTLAAAAYQLLIGPHEIWGDGWVRFDTLVKLVDKGEISARPCSIIHSFLSAPLYMLGKLFGRGGDFAAYFSVLVFHLTLIFTYRLLRKHMPAAVLRRTILLLVAASMFGNHVQSYYGEVLTTCGVILGISALVTDRPVIAGVAMCVAVINTPVAGLGLLLCNGLWALRTRRWFQAAWPVVLSPALILLEFWWRRGSPFHSGYEGRGTIRSFMPYSGQTEGFTYPLLLGLFSLLFSYGRGILFYAPGLLLHYVKTPGERNSVMTRFAELSMVFFWGMVLAYSKWWCWFGAWFWGQRFLLIGCVPASFAIARHLSSRGRRHILVTLLTIVVVAWSAWVGVNGTVIKEIETEPCMMNHYYWESICFYVPEFSPLIHPLIEPKPLHGWDKAELYLGAAVALTLLLPMLAVRLRDHLTSLLSRRG